MVGLRPIKPWGPWGFLGDHVAAIGGCWWFVRGVGVSLVWTLDCQMDVKCGSERCEWNWCELDEVEVKLV